MDENANARVSPLTQENKKPYTARTLAKSPPRGQLQNYKRLAQTIHKRELTTSLEILAAKGIKDNLAIFILANLQTLEGAEREVSR